MLRALGIGRILCRELNSAADSHVMSHRQAAQPVLKSELWHAQSSVPPLAAPELGRSRAGLTEPVAGLLGLSLSLPALICGERGTFAIS